MNQPCLNMQDKIAEFVLGAMDAEQAEALRQHLGECSGCRQYLHSLKEQSESLVELGRQIGGDMTARQDRVIEALQNVPPAESLARRVFPFVKTAVAAVLILGVGITIGRWTAPRPVNVEQLRADLQASIAASIQPLVQTSVLAQVDRRLQAEAQRQAELALQTHKDLYMLAEQCTGLENLVKDRFTELVDIIEAGRKTDRWRVEKALQEMRTQTGLGLEALAVCAGEPAATVHD